MWEPTPTVTIICFSITLGVYALVVYACVLQFRYWHQNIRGQPIGGGPQTARLLLWLLGVIITAFCGIVLLWVLGQIFVWYISILLS